MELATLERLTPQPEIEKKYLVDSMGETMSEVLQGVRDLLPKGTQLLDIRHQTDYYLPEMTLSDMHEDRALGGIATKFGLNSAEEDGNTKLSMRMKTFNGVGGRKQVVSMKSGLHGIDRDEFQDIVINTPDELAIRSAAPAETEWYAHRFEFKLPDDTVVYIQEVSGYGFTLEIEAESEELVDSWADSFGLTPISEKLLDTMYRYYRDEFYSEDELRDEQQFWTPKHFSESDWERIAELAGEEPVFNRLKKI